MTVLQQYAQEQDVWRGKPGETYVTVYTISSISCCVPLAELKFKNLGAGGGGGFRVDGVSSLVWNPGMSIWEQDYI